MVQEEIYQYFIKKLSKLPHRPQELSLMANVDAPALGIAILCVLRCVDALLFQ